MVALKYSNTQLYFAWNTIYAINKLITRLTYWSSPSITLTSSNNYFKTTNSQSNWFNMITPRIAINLRRSWPLVTTSRVHRHQNQVYLDRASSTNTYLYRLRLGAPFHEIFNKSKKWRKVNFQVENWKTELILNDFVTLLFNLLDS